MGGPLSFDSPVAWNDPNMENVEIASHIFMFTQAVSKIESIWLVDNNIPLQKKHPKKQKNY